MTGQRPEAGGTDVQTRPTMSPEEAADRFNTFLVVVVLVLDAALLAMMELLFLTAGFGSISVPVTPLVALVTNPWLVRRAGELGGRLAAALPLIVWVLTIGVLGLAEPGGGLLLLGDPLAAVLLLAAGMLPAAFVLGRVLRTRRSGTS